ncbi:class I SAM-dependent DNA methyltransferase [Kitasatospora sp. LaBMicrA B282]|uniref:class I SAM-dependent DNA methyltransferase n=1 Tax=Kitasatospora sp. LaBMicrA B282 TaxID=3420949 RepID=UPI003D0AA151
MAPTDTVALFFEDRATASARLFDALGMTYQDLYCRLPAQLDALDWLLARLPAGAAVLDIGSGTGQPTAARLTAAGHRVTGIDVSRTMVDLARAQVPAARFEVADVCAVPDTPGVWDAITAFFPLLQLSRADQVMVLGRIASWLAPGGLFAFATVPFDAEDTELTWLGRRVRVTSFPSAAFARLLRAAGLVVLHEQESVFRPDFPGADPEEHLFLYAAKPGGRRSRGGG